jgi:hypothetical protein
MKVRIRIDTVSDIANFVLAVEDVKEEVYVTDGKKLCINGKSFLGLAHAKEFTELYCECDQDISGRINQFII